MDNQAGKGQPITPWRSRIIGHGEEAPDQLLANPANWRVHPKAQQDALAGVLNEVGWVQDVIVNQRSGFVLDGHLRVSLAISRGEPTVPVVYVDLDEHEERLVLASLDPLSALAVCDKEQLESLLRDVTTTDEALMAMLGQLAEKAGVVPPAEMAGNQAVPEQYLIMIECASEHEQTALLDQLLAEGRKCRALVS